MIATPTPAMQAGAEQLLASPDRWTSARRKSDGRPFSIVQGRTGVYYVTPDVKHRAENVPENPARRPHADAPADERRDERPYLGLVADGPDRVPRDAQHEQDRHDTEVRRHPFEKVPDDEPPREHGRPERDEGHQRERSVKRARPRHGDHEQHCPQA